MKKTLSLLVNAFCLIAALTLLLGCSKENEVQIEDYEKDIISMSSVFAETDIEDLANRSNYVVRAKVEGISDPYRVKIEESNELTDYVHKDLNFKILENYKGELPSQIKVQTTGGEFVDSNDETIYITENDGQVEYEEIKNKELILFLADSRPDESKLDDDYYSLVGEKSGVLIIDGNELIDFTSEVFPIEALDQIDPSVDPEEILIRNLWTNVENDVITKEAVQEDIITMEENKIKYEDGNAQRVYEDLK